jgi:hypothetical protein
MAVLPNCGDNLLIESQFPQPNPTTDYIYNRLYYYIQWELTFHYVGFDLEYIYSDPAALFYIYSTKDDPAAWSILMSVLLLYIQHLV